MFNPQQYYDGTIPNRLNARSARDKWSVKRPGSDTFSDTFLLAVLVGAVGANQLKLDIGKKKYQRR